MAIVAENVTWANGAGGGTALNATNLNNFRLNTFNEVNGSLDNTNLSASAAIDFTKLAALTRGSVLIGNSSNAAAAVDAKTDGQILVGDGTDLGSVAVSGDIGLTNAGVASISSGVIVNADVNASAAIVGSKLDLTAPGAIGSVTPSTGAFTTLAGTAITGSTSLALATGATVTGIADEDDMISDSATLLATQQSIKAYVDNSLSDTGVLQTVTGTLTTQPSGITTVINFDNTIPQNTEGTEVLTQAITRQSASSTLEIEVIIHMNSDTVGVRGTVALFQDSTANALAVSEVWLAAGGGAMDTVTLRHSLASGSTGATTFKIRAGISSGTLYINGISTGRKYGGTAITSLNIKEIL